MPDVIDKDLDGPALKRLRETGLEWTQQQLVDYLNKSLDRSYDTKRASRWENGAEAIPKVVQVQIRELLTRREAQAAEPAATPARGPIVIAIANQKGGVGKTTTAINLGHALASRGLPTLVVDMDPQSNATLHLGQSPVDLDRAGRTLYDAMLGRPPAPMEDIVLRVGGEMPLDLVPSSLRMSRGEGQLMTEPDSSLVLREKLALVKNRYAFVIVDCPPHLGLLTVNGLAAADWVLIPTQTEAMSAMGVPLLIETVRSIQSRSNPTLQVLGLLPTMHQSRLADHKLTLAELKEAWEAKMRIFETVPRATVFSQSAAAGRPVFEMGVKGQGIAAYMSLAEQVLEIFGEAGK